jgi:ankyrin repeat protein
MSASGDRDSFPAQRWERPLDVPPGYWKRQLPAKHLLLGAKGDIPALHSLLQEHPDFLNKKGSHNRTLLWEAVRGGRTEAVRFLVGQGADIHIPGCYNSETHVQVTPYCAAVYYKRPDIAAFLQSKGPEHDLFRLAFLGDAPAVMRLLDNHPEQLYAEDPFDDIYFTPLLSFAVAGGHVGLVETLIDRGAAVAPYSAQFLYLAARVPRLDIVYTLVSKGAAVGAVDVGIFVSVSDLSVLRYLLDHGASARRPGKNGFPPLVYLSRGDKGENPDKVRLMLEYGAEVNATGLKGRTALHYAASAGHLKVIALLLEYGADVRIKDDEGRTAQGLALARRKKAAADLLASKGA